MIDVIFTITRRAGLHCCVATEMGLLYGVRSSDVKINGSGLCRRYYTDSTNKRVTKGHEIVFIDNEYKNYDHNLHFEVVKTHRPKYATVLDVFNPLQCKNLGIKYTPFKQILEWAYELKEYAENVIVIPKYDIIDYIPNDFMLGYSVPSNYGGTNIPVERFKGKRVHLLGGSTRKQVELIRQLGKDVVSVDTNYFTIPSEYGNISEIDLAKQYGGFGVFWTNNKTFKLANSGIGYFDKPFWPAFILNANNYYQIIKSVYREVTS